MKKIVLVGSGLLALCYIIGIFVFQDRFYFRSYINGMDCGGKTVKKVEMQMAEQVKNYTLKLKGKNGVIDEIKGQDIRLYYVSDRTVSKLKEKQPAYNWLFGSLKQDNDDMKINVTYSASKLIKKVDQLHFFDKENIIQSELPKIQYKDDKLVVEDAVYGTEIKKKLLKKKIKEAIESGKTELDLEKENCYKKPLYDEKDPQFAEMVKKIKKYVATNITYEFGDRTENLTGKQIFEWISVDKDFKVEISEEKRKEFVKELERKYNTLGNSRTFTTHDGRTISVPSGNYGYMISRSGEMEQMLEDIKSGKTVKREPKYAYTGYIRNKDDIGNTYVEIDLTNQKMIFYLNGGVYVKTDIVTGNVSSGYGTPAGVFAVTYKEKDATLSGENYSVPVKYWMPFNRNIGIHDASWRSSFGGDIYKTKGSHGCINTPEEKAAKIFNKIEKGMPVIVHY